MTEEVRPETGPAARPPGYGLAVARFLVGCGLGAVAVALLAGLWLPWWSGLSAWSLLGGSGWSGASGALWWMIVLAPVTLALSAVALARSRRPARLPLMLVTFVGTVCLLGSGPHQAYENRWLGWGLGVAVVGYPLAFLLSVALFVLSRKDRPAGGVRPARAVAVAGLVPVLVAAGLVGVGGRWYADRKVDATTAGTAVPPVTGSPGRVLWQSRASELGPVPLAGGLVAFNAGQYGDVAVVDAATGKPRWHYSRRDAELKAVTASRDQHTVLAEYGARAGTTVLGFDAATGAQRWQWWAPRNDLKVELRSNVVVAFTPDDHGTAVAVDPSTGRRRWSLTNVWSRTDNDRNCFVGIAGAALGAVASDQDLTVLLVQCGGPARAVIHAVDRTGHLRWSTTYPVRSDESPSTPPDVELDPMSGSGPVLALSLASNRVIALDRRTGHVDWTVNEDTFASLAIGTGDTVLTGTDLGEGQLRQVDAATGAPTATQPPANLSRKNDFIQDIEVKELPGGGALSGSLAVRDGRAYLLSVSRTTGTTLKVLDLHSDRVLWSCPVRDSSASLTGEAVFPGPGYAVVAMAGHPEDEAAVDVVVRLPGG